MTTREEIQWVPVRDFAELREGVMVRASDGCPCRGKHVGIVTSEPKSLSAIPKRYGPVVMTSMTCDAPMVLSATSVAEDMVERAVDGLDADADLREMKALEKPAAERWRQVITAVRR